MNEREGVRMKGERGKIMGCTVVGVDKAYIK